MNELVKRAVRSVCVVLTRRYPSHRVDADAVLCTAERSSRGTRLARQLVLYTLHDLCGCSHGEISRAVGISKRNVMRSVSLMRGVWGVWPDHEAMIEEIRSEMMEDGDGGE